MDLEPCFKVHNLAVIQLQNTKLGQMTNFEVVFHVVLFLKLATRCSPLLNLKVANMSIVINFLIYLPVAGVTAIGSDTRTKLLFSVH